MVLKLFKHCCFSNNSLLLFSLHCHANSSLVGAEVFFFFFFHWITQPSSSKNKHEMNISAGIHNEKFLSVTTRLP